MMSDFRQKYGLVTGAGSGIGRASAKLFAQAGAGVIVSDISEAAGEQTVREIVDAGGSAEFCPADVSKMADQERLVETVLSRFGRLNFAHNNAGIVEAGGPASEIDEAEWDHVMNVNLKGILFGMKAQIPVMISQGGGAIVNTSSLSGFVVVPGTGIYTASKHAVIGLTRTAAIDHAKSGVRINALCPGLTDTAMVRGSSDPDALIQGLMPPMGRVGRPEEIAIGAIWMCSDEASFMTGQTIAIDGGYLCM